MSHTWSSFWYTYVEMLGKRLFGNLDENGNGNAFFSRKRPRFANAPKNVPKLIELRYNTNTNRPMFDFDCMPTTAGNVVRAVAPSPLPNVANLPQVRYASMQEVLEHPGDYTWVLFADNSFMAARVLSPREILSKHKNLHRAAPERRLVAAGECRIGPNRTVLFNLESGTYMAHAMNVFRRKYRTTDVDDFYRDAVSQQWLAAGATHVQYSYTLFVPKVASGEMLAPYEALGYTFEHFRDMEACRAAVAAARGGSRTRRHRRKHRRTRKQKK